MATVTSPIILDSTGQSIDAKLGQIITKLDNLAAAFQPNASGITYSNTTSGLTGDDVQEAIDEVAGDVSQINASLSNIKHVPITTSTATFPSTVSIQGDNYYQKNGKLVIVNVNLKIVSSTKGWHRVTNYIPNDIDKPLYTVLGNASDGDVDGIMQPFDITNQGTLEIYNTKTGTTYCQGSVAYFASDLS